MRHYYTNLLEPISKAKGPRTRRGYFTIRDGALINPRPIGATITGYLNSRGDEMSEGSGLRLRVTAAHDVDGACIEHKGWYTDDYQVQTIYGIVARLPRSRGFLAGWTMGAGMISELDRGTVWDSEIDAARDADRQAERMAEREREYEEKWQAAQRVRDLLEDICDARRQHTALIRAIWTGERDDAIGARLRAACRASVRRARREIADILATYGDEIMSAEYA